MAKRLDELDYYALLHVKREATVDAIKEAFHRFARKYHPDRVAGDPKLVSRHTRIYRRGTEAYRVLTNVERRRAYDAGLPDGQLRYDPEAVPSPRAPTMPPGQAGARASARPFITKANLALRQRDYRQARLHLQVALTHDPDNAEVQTLLARVEAQLRGPQ